jgi:hypothetical protein
MSIIENLPPRRMLTSEIVSYDVRLARFLQSKNAAILLFFLTNSFHKKDDFGWLQATSDGVEEKTALSSKEQDRAISVLIKHKIIQKKRVGLPAKRYFLINEDLLNDLIENN